jgi:hypothetical protein
MLSLDLVWNRSGLGLDFAAENREQGKAKTGLVAVAPVMRILLGVTWGVYPYLVKSLKSLIYEFLPVKYGNKTTYRLRNRKQKRNTQGFDALVYIRSA